MTTKGQATANTNTNTEILSFAQNDGVEQVKAAADARANTKANAKTNAKANAKTNAKANTGVLPLRQAQGQDDDEKQTATASWMRGCVSGRRW
jgi:hypothetical protein